MNMAQILMFADVPSAYEELACAARALGGEPVALYAGPRAGAEEITGYGAKVLYFGENEQTSNRADKRLICHSLGGESETPVFFKRLSQSIKAPAAWPNLIDRRICLEYVKGIAFTVIYF